MRYRQFVTERTAYGAVSRRCPRCEGFVLWYRSGDLDQTARQVPAFRPGKDRATTR